MFIFCILHSNLWCWCSDVLCWIACWFSGLSYSAVCMILMFCCNVLWCYTHSVLVLQIMILTFCILEHSGDADVLSFMIFILIYLLEILHSANVLCFMFMWLWSSCLLLSAMLDSKFSVQFIFVLAKGLARVKCGGVW